MDSNKSNDSYIPLIDVSDNSDNECEIENQNKKNKSNIVLKDIQRVVRNWRKCFACNERRNLQRPSKKMRSEFMKSKKIFIEKNDRVCEYHSKSENWDICCKKSSVFSSKMISEMVNFLLTLSSDETKSEPPLNIGLTLTEFKQILFELGIQESPTKAENKIVLAVKLYIERLYTGHTYTQMGLRYKMSRVSIGQLVKRGRKILLEHFISNHLGYRKCSRQWLKDHTTDFARMLYCDNNPEKIVVICDGTYIYTCGSKNYAHQKCIYSGQKKRHLFKIMKFVAVDGTIIDVFGPFPAKTNDADILKIIFDQSSIKNIFNAGDVILVDRGFRDAIKVLKKMQLDVRMPDFIKKGEGGQLTTKQCNESRLITKMRFCIEAANGRMKMKWHLFNKIIPSILTINLMSDYKIASAIVNAFGQPILCEKENYLDIGEKMLNRLHTKNDLPKIINMKFNSIAKFFISVPPEELIFPVLNENQLKQFCLGNYAMKQAVSYTAYILNIHNTFPVFLLPDQHVETLFKNIYEKKNFNNPKFILANVESRFRGGKLHKVFILFDGIEININKFLFYCSCQYGKRTISCCGHSMAVVWYFGYGRHQPNKNPSSYLDNFFNINFE